MPRVQTPGSSPVHPSNLGERNSNPTNVADAAGEFSRRRLLTLAGAGVVAASGLVGCDSSTEPCPQPTDVSGAVTRPVRISGENPSYTEEARQARIQGVVILQLIIDCRGDVTNVMVLRGLPLGLTEAAVDAVRQWRYRPATLDGVAVSVFFNITINFRLQ